MPRYFTGREYFKLMYYQSFSQKDFWDKFKVWLYGVRDITYKHCDTYGIERPTFHVKNRGSHRYIRVWMEHLGKKKVFCYIDRINGDIHKYVRKSKKYPGRGQIDFAPRGNIFDESNGLSMIEPFGLKAFRIRENPLFWLRRRMNKKKKLDSQ